MLKDGMKLKLRNIRSSKNTSVAEHIMRLYKRNPHYPNLADEVELYRFRG
jgi:hypothetical protein